MLTENWMTVTDGDEVAILPYSDSPASEVLDIKTVVDTEPVIIRLCDGQLFTQLGGASLGGFTYIVPATDQHRAALKAKGK